MGFRLRGFFKTVAIVTIFSTCEKFLGFLYRIYLSRTIGAEGVGLYQVALSVFAFLLTLTCSGTPITVSRLITKYNAENKKERVNKLITSALVFTLFVSLAICLLFFSLKKFSSLIFADDRCVSIFYVVLIGLIFTSLYSIVRGVFWGKKDFLPYSIIELLEEICMIVVGIILISTTTEVFLGAYYAGVAVLISYVFSFTLAFIVFFMRGNRIINPKGEFKPLLSSAMPVTAMRTINSLAISIVSIILPLRLVSAGFSSSEAMSLYGSAVGQAIPILFIPTTLIGSFTIVLVPEIAENFYNKNHKRLKTEIEKAVKFTAILSNIFIPVFFVCGEEIGLIIFGNTDCGKFLTASAFLMLFMSLSSLSTSILNSIGQEKKALSYCIISGAFMLACVYLLPKYMGIYSLLIGYSFVYGLTTVLNVILLRKKCKYKPKFIGFIIFSTLLLFPSIILGYMLEKLLLSLLGTMLTFIVCSVVLVAFTILLYACFNVFDINIILKRLKRKTA